jgi:hypothetical protein
MGLASPPIVFPVAVRGGLAVVLNDYPAHARDGLDRLDELWDTDRVRKLNVERCNDVFLIIVLPLLILHVGDLAPSFLRDSATRVTKEWTAPLRASAPSIIGRGRESSFLCPRAPAGGSTEASQGSQPFHGSSAWDHGSSGHAGSRMINWRRDSNKTAHRTALGSE